MEKHKSVLLEETINGLNIKDNGIYVDMTLGYGGHSSEILKRIPKGHLYAFDQDNEAISFAEKKLNEISSNYTIIKSNFVNVKKCLNDYNIEKVDGIIFDLGVSSPQLDESNRGFSYHNDAKLDMRMDKDNPLSAYEVVNNYKEEDLKRILYTYGEEKYASSIVKNIVKERNIKPIETTLELVKIISDSVPMKEKLKKHPAKKTFQAIRIEVNDELRVFEKALTEALTILDIEGRICVITFHSLEDRICKTIFKKFTEVDKFIKGLPNIQNDMLPNYRLITTKAVKPSNSELESNNRSRSAKLRIIERVK